MYFKYLLVAILLACTNGKKVQEVNVNGEPNSTPCTCDDGVQGVVFFGACGYGYDYCGDSKYPIFPCCEAA